MYDCKFYDKIRGKCTKLRDTSCNDKKICTFYITEKQFAERALAAIEANLKKGNCSKCICGDSKRQTCMKIYANSRVKKENNI